VVLQSLSAELALDFGIPLIEACKQPASESGIADIVFYGPFNTIVNSSPSVIELIYRKF